MHSIAGPNLCNSIMVATGALEKRECLLRGREYVRIGQTFSPIDDLAVTVAVGY